MRERVVPKVLTWRAAIAESGLPRTTRAVAWALANYMNERGESAFPGVERLCRDVGSQRGDKPASKTTVIDALRELQEAGYLTRVAAGGGRRKRGEWHARLPETVQQLNRNEAAGGPQIDPDAAAAPDAPMRFDGARVGDSDQPETVQSQDPLRAVERVQSPAERVQSQLGNGSATEPEVVVEVGQEIAAATRARDSAAAAEIQERLGRLNIVDPLRARALAEPERALAWLELVAQEAKRNPAGLFRIGFESGSWPSPRIDPDAETPGDRLEAYRRSLRQFVAMPDEARYFIDHEWETLTRDERTELHEYFDQILSGVDVVDELITAQLRVVDAA